MSKNLSSSRVFASRIALVAVIAGLLLSFAGAATNAANFSIVDSVRGLFGLASSNSVVPQSEIKLSDGEDPTAGTVSLTTLGSAYTQNFDTLSNTAGSTTNVIAITGWDLTETGGGARDNEQYGVDTGGSTTGDTYSYGAAASTERAFGGLQSGTLIPVIGASFTNNTGSTITSANIAYTGEEWRLGTQSRADRIDFQYSTDATSLTTGTWIDVDALDFTTPNTGATVGALDGNAAANRTAISNTIGSLNIPNGATFWIRYNDLNATGADDGLAIDDFSLTPNGSVTPTPTNTPTHTPTNTPTATPTNTPTATPTNTPTATPTNTPTATPTDTPTATPTATPSASPTASATPVFSISDVSLNEGNFTTTTFTFTITKTGENGSVSTVYYATQDGTANGTANSGNDYNSLGGLPPAPEGGCGAFCVEFLPGETSKTVDVIVNGDTNVETDETFFLNLVSVSNGVLGDSSGLGTIVNDDTPGSHTLYGIANGFGVPSNNQIYTIDALTGSATNFHPITVQGFIVRNSIALAERPADGAIFGVLVLDLGNPVRPDGNSTEGNLPTYHLVTINPATGVATDIGPLAQEIQSLSFRPFANRNSGEGQSNTLYGISGNTGSSPRTLFAVDTSNAALSTVMALNNGSGCGQAIAFSDNGFLYHAAGGTCYLSSPSVEGGVFERVNVDTQDVVFVGPITTEVFALGYSTAFGQMFLNEGNGDLYTISLVNGFKNFIGTIAPGMRGEGSDAGSGLGQPLPNRGLAFAPGVGSISMVKTVGLDPETCGVANALSVSAGTTVYYCYTVTNTGGVAFTNHSLYDDVLGTILNGYSFLLNPGQSMHVISAPYVVTETITNTATWVADTNSGGGKRPGGGKTRPEGGGGGGAQAQSMSPVTVAVNGTCQNYAKTTPAFDFTEINATGTQISLGDDDMSGAIPVGFNFNYFGTTYTDVYVSSNGFLTVLPGQSPTFVSAPMTNPGDPNGVIAPFWNDLYPPAAPVGGGVIYQTVGSPGNRVLIVEYKSIPNFGSSNPDYTFQVKLFENGNAIEFHYLTTNNDGSFGSAGIENETGTLGKQFYLGTGNIPDNTAVRYAPCGAATPTPTATPTPCAGGSNIIVDGGFEAGSPWPGWTTQTSTNFGTSICNTSNCNSNSGNTAPRTGTNWLWFGGGTGGQAENSTNGQSFVIPAGTAELRFWMKVQNVITPFSDTMTVRIDGNPVQVFTEPATAEAAYTERVINLSAFANGASHSLVFDYVGTDGASNFLIDDISVIASGSCVPASQADLAIVKTDGVTNVSAGGSTTYTITVTNNGPDPAVNAIVQDLFPAGVIVDNWSCLPQNSAFCTLAGAGNINDTVYIPVGGILTYTALARLNPNQVGTLVNTATVTPPSSVTDPNLANNTSTDTDNFVVTLSGNVKQYVAGGPNANLAGVTMTLGPVNATTVTDASGNYSFANLNAGQSWTITPTMAGKVFDTVSRTFNNVTADIGGINFIAYNTNGIPRNISVVNSFATPGNTVTVPIRMTSQGTEKTMSFSLDYPLGVLNTPVVTCGVSTPGCAVTSTNVTPGKLGVTITAASAVAAGLREIANITFQTNVGFAPPNAALNFSDTPTARLVTDPLGDTLQATFANGFVIFVDGVEGDVVGRPSGDGTVVSTDVTQIRRFVAGLDTPDASVNEFQRADVAPIVTWGDGLILPGDVVQARRYSARLDLQQAAAGPGGPALPPLGTGTAPVEEVAAVATSRAIGVTTVNSDPGSRVSVNVELAPQGDEAAMSFTVAFDASRLRNPQVSLAGGMGDGAVLTVNSNDADRGRIGILVDSTEALAVGSAARPVITVTFDVTGDATGGLARVRLTDGVAPRGVAGIMGDTLDARYTDGGVVISGPAAAGVEMSGRVTTSDGRGVRNATVTIIDGNGYARTVVTSTFGYYRFDGVMPGEMYSIGVLSRNYHFAPRTFTVGDNLADVDFTAVD